MNYFEGLCPNETAGLQNNSLTQNVELIFQSLLRQIMLLQLCVSERYIGGTTPKDHMAELSVYAAVELIKAFAVGVHDTYQPEVRVAVARVCCKGVGCRQINRYGAGAQLGNKIRTEPEEVGPIFVRSQRGRAG